MGSVPIQDHIGHLVRVRWRDAGSRRLWLPAASLVELLLGDGSRVQARPSGTEPKLKIYVDVRGEASSASRVPAVEKAALRRASDLGAALAATMGL